MGQASLLKLQARIRAGGQGRFPKHDDAILAGSLRLHSALTSPRHMQPSSNDHPSTNHFSVQTTLTCFG